MVCNHPRPDRELLTPGLIFVTLDTFNVPKPTPARLALFVVDDVSFETRLRRFWFVDLLDFLREALCCDHDFTHSWDCA